MRPRRRHAAGLALLLLAAPARAQDAAAPEPAAPPAEAAPANPKPRPKPKPKPAVPQAASEADSGKPDSGKPNLSTLDLSKPEDNKPGAARAEPGGDPGTKTLPAPGRPAHPAEMAAPPGSAVPDARKDGEASSAARTQFAPPEPSPPSPPSPLPPPPPASRRGAGVACDPGQSVLYDEPNGFSFWVTRSGSITINNPLRPLTPDVTRVLQLVIAGKLATAYGPDLTVLSRGGPPAAVESLIGGPIRWDAGLGTLPDTLDIVTDSGAPLAQMRFKECGTAPDAKAPAPVAGKEPKAARGRNEGRRTGTAKPQPGPGPNPTDMPASLGPAQAGAAPPRRFNMPQGAIPE